MAGDAELDERIDEVAAGPKSAQGDMGNITEQSLADLIKLKKLKDAETAVGSGGPKLLMVRLVPPGAK